MARGGRNAGAGHDSVRQVRSAAGVDGGEPATLRRRTDEPGAATTARFQVGIDLLSQHLRTLTVQSRR